MLALLSRLFFAIDFYLRVFATGLWFLATSIICMPILPFRWQDPSMGATFARILHWGGMRIMGLRTKIINHKALYLSQPCVYIGNHQSNLDIFTYGGIYPWRTAVIGKKELKKIPLFGTLFVGSGNVLIDRKDRINSLQGLDAARRAIVEDGTSIWIFPEGTRNRGARDMLPFKKGAFYLAITAQVPIIPLVQQHLKSYFDAKNRRIIHGEVLMRVLNPIPTTGMTTDDVPTLMASVRKAMESELAQPEMKPE